MLERRWVDDRLAEGGERPQVLLDLIRFEVSSGWIMDETRWEVVAGRIARLQTKRLLTNRVRSLTFFFFGFAEYFNLESYSNLNSWITELDKQIEMALRESYCCLDKWDHVRGQWLLKHESVSASGKITKQTRRFIIKNESGIDGGYATIQQFHFTCSYKPWISNNGQ